jgi:unsaturated rhamnogalacturonyl hydrolase
MAMINYSLWALMGVGLLAASCRHTEMPASRLVQGLTPLEWSARMAHAQMTREGDGLQWSETGRKKWDYAAGLFTFALLKLNEAQPDSRYVKFSEAWIDSFITPDGTIRTFKTEEYNIDSINPGKTLLALWKVNEKKHYRQALELLRNQLRNHPRTSEGGFWHKQRYPSQMWLDGLYMGAPFYAEFVKVFGPATDFDDVVKQFRLMHRAAYDARTGLHYHGWNEDRKQEWADPVTGTSSQFWGRGLGWFAMALVDTLDSIPTEHPGRQELITIFQKTCEGIVKVQDAETGLWWQVLDQGGRPGNYREATAACMFVYSMAKGVNRGYLPENFAAPALKGYQGIIAKQIRQEKQGGLSLTSCCQVAGLGYGRDGSYAYYLREPVVDNDLKGVGPFILAGIEVQKLLSLP